ncbi:helix-turn-helix transcriptional regulator [Methylocapsa acidiphila]|uniref:helix-turn-helix transcriptional regulator n=1 Tax=Methylocapsa acidiphila TaxID=133552 RepID=UPI0003F6F842|nr:LuxR family transcriptional regulator [Methylocapsa acidiphila]
MPLDDLGLRALLQLEGELTDQSLEHFIDLVCRRYGLSNIAYVCPSFRGYSLTNPFITLTYSKEWVEHYRTQEYMFIDPAWTIAARSLLPIDWARLPRTDKKVQRIFGEATDAGVGQQGLTIPVRGPINGLWGIFVANSHDGDAEWSNRRYELIRDLVLVANYVHQRAYELHVEERPVDLNAITRREIEALEWTADGKSVEDIAVLMRISAVTVKAHLDSARHKLAALNRVHAVTKAIRAGLIR